MDNKFLFSGDSMVSTEKLVKAGAHGATGGLAGFLFGLGIQAVAEAAGVAAISTIPVGAILPVFTILSVVLGFAHGFTSDKK